jgi:large subunit ribosomal protein L25
MSELNIAVDPRPATGKNANRQSRLRGKIPAVVYGGGKESVAIEVDRKTFVDMMKGHVAENPIFLLKLGDKERHAMIRNLQTDPVSRQVIHIDFQRVAMDQKIRVTVPIELTGTAVGIKTEGGLLDFVTREVHVECLPGDIPKHLDLDISGLHVGQHVAVKNLAVPEGVHLFEDGERVIASIAHARTEAAPVEEEAAAVTTAEPEVIRKAKTEE